MTFLAVLPACQRSSSQAEGRAGENPFEALELIRTKLPTPAPSFVVAGPGGSLSLEHFRQRVVLLNFWATWCPPCREEMPSMERLYRRYKDRGVTILAISIDTNIDAVAPFVRRYGLTFPIGLDPSSAVAKEYGMRALPTTYLIDAAGQIVALAAGARDWDGAAAKAVVESLLQGVPR